MKTYKKKGNTAGLFYIPSFIDVLAKRNMNSTKRERIINANKSNLKQNPKPVTLAKVNLGEDE